ncbi:Aste57867_10413 [Aphanomyces stellatus]|uniref:Aste57867_10413 protein n=1 Tax=Aphanomyces stellatus TaxID=120398 RepID=A0A485KQU0_9STRA|nr:hypothetical protein As57867_010373 [Aphanomyces stellatus]VFT87287.1 Aste57867_10413 [Aphanomyces stellatus]
MEHGDTNTGYFICLSDGQKCMRLLQDKQPYVGWNTIAAEDVVTVRVTPQRPLHLLKNGVDLGQAFAGVDRTHLLCPVVMFCSGCVSIVEL